MTARSMEGGSLLSSFKLNTWQLFIPTIVNFLLDSWSGLGVGGDVIWQEVGVVENKGRKEGKRQWTENALSHQASC